MEIKEAFIRGGRQEIPSLYGLISGNIRNQAYAACSLTFASELLSVTCYFYLLLLPDTFL